MRIWPCTLIALAGLAAGATTRAAEEGSLPGTRELVRQWVQTRQLVSQTQSDWDRDREVLEQTRALYERELQSLTEAMSRIATNSTQVETERVTSEAQRRQAIEALDRAVELVTALEEETRRLIPLLPDPLLEQARPFLLRIPTPSATTKAPITERLQALVGLLNEADKFNASVAVVSGRQAGPDGREVSVDTLYLGLAVAYFTDPTGSVAGVGRPTESGWSWTLQPALGSRIRDAIAMYRNAQQAAFVGLPLRLD